MTIAIYAKGPYTEDNIILDLKDKIIENDSDQMLIRSVEDIRDKLLRIDTKKIIQILVSEPIEYLALKNNYDDILKYITEDDIK